MTDSQDVHSSMISRIIAALRHNGRATVASHDHSVPLEIAIDASSGAVERVGRDSAGTSGPAR